MNAPATATRRVLVTGATGFIGARVAADLAAHGFEVRRMVRAGPAAQDAVCADLLDPPSLARACAGVELVVHCAGLAHVFGGREREEALHDAVNFGGTVALAEAAAAAGVRHLVFLSSVKAMGAPGAVRADEDWPVPPETPYGRAKRAAEEALAELSVRRGMAVTSLRLAMVYGRGSRGNLERMLAGIRAGWFPPLPDTAGVRSLVHVSDAVSAVRAVLDEPRAFGRVWIVAHGEAHTAAAIQDCARSLLARPPLRWRLPAAWLRGAGRVGDLAGRLAGRPMPLDSAVVARLLEAEHYSPDAIRDVIGWVARMPLVDGLRETLGESGSGR